MKGLLLSGYDAASHRRWRLGLERSLPDFQFTQVALPPRYFSWRIRGSSLSLAGLSREVLEQPYDFLIATSMVDLSSLRGMLPAIARLPTLLYFHENQFAYPASGQQHHSLEPQIVTLYSAICADRLAFNSRYNRRTFLEGAEALLGKMPDLVPRGVVDALAVKSSVLPVPLEDELFLRKSAPKLRANRPTLIWNHRWEYDKNPRLLLEAMGRICEHYRGRFPFVAHIVGEQFRREPEAFAPLKQLLQQAGALGNWGYVVDAEQYRELLLRSHIALSTADHDFQGLAVLEAVASGCLPVVPKHQVYPEMLGDNWCYPVTGDLHSDAEALAMRLVELVDGLLADRLPAAPDVSALAWSGQREIYRQCLHELAGGATQLRTESVS